MIHKTTRSILSVLLAALLLVTSIPLTPAFAGDGGAVSLQSESGEGGELAGNGTKDNPYQIGSAEQLAKFRDKVNSGETDASAVLTDDINLNPNMDISEDGTVTTGNEPDRWIPIGSINPYRGTFNGDGHTISGLYINDSSADYQGLFGFVGSEGTVKDLGVSGSVSGNNYVGGIVGNNLTGAVTNCAFSGTVSGNSSVGGVVGDNISSVTNSYNTGEVSGNSSVGGVVGNNEGRSVENCYNIGEVSGSHVGGVVGYNNGPVKNCYNTGEVSGNSSVGGVVGDNLAGVTNCYNTGKVTGPDSGTGNRVGGVVGLNSGIVENCYNTGKVSGPNSGNSNQVGGVVGDNSRIVTNCYNTGKVSGNSSVGGVVGDNSRNVTGCYFLKTDDVNKDLQGIGNDSGTTGATAVNDLDELCEKFKDDTTNTWRISKSLNRPVLQDNAQDGLPPGLGTEASPYEISTADELKNFATAVNKGIEKSAHAKLMNNIDLKDVCGPTLNNGTSWTPIGSISSNPYSGTFNGNGHTISGLYINNSTADYQGLFGYVDQGGTVQNLSVSGTVNSSYVGGVVGLNSGNVENCYNIGDVSGGDVSGNSSVVGGVVGYNNGSVTNCYNTGEVSGKISVGGVVGYNNSGTVKNCYNTGNVSGGSKGGVVGYNISSGTSAIVENCYYQIDKGATFGIGGTTGDNSSQTEVKSLKDFQSGEVAYLLQSTQTTPVWGQNIGEDKSPVLTSDQEKNVYKVTINLNDSDSTENKTRYTNSDLQALTPTREGYTFGGWYADKDCTGERVTTITDLTDTTATLYAKWTANEYTVTLNTDGGTIAEGQNISSYTYGIGATLPTSVTREGYTFAGWYEKEDFTGDPVAAIGKDAMGDKTYWAKWEEVENPDPTPTPTPDPTPSGPSTGDSSGWDDIRDELENAAKGDQITIDMGDETKVPAEIFESVAGKDVDVTFDLGDDLSWTVNGKDIPDDAALADLDLGVALDTDGIPVNVINTITGEVGTVQITLAHNGEFGFTMTLTAPLGKENAGYWANLYHFDESAEALNFEAAAKIDEDGSVKIPFSHASQYAIVIDTHSHATVDVSDIFIDVAPNAWYKDAVQYAYAGGLMTGVSDTEFAPEATTTRAMIVSILARLEGVTTAEAAGFADVDDEWYATAVNWAANVGVVNGYEDNTFRPNQPITREQLAAILMNYASYKGEDVSNRADLGNYTDQPSTWATETMSWAVAEGLINGVTNDQLQPQGNATRAQVAAILQRFLSE